MRRMVRAVRSLAAHTPLGPFGSFTTPSGMTAICAQRPSTTLSSLDRHPIERGSQVVLGVLHQFPSEATKVGHLARVVLVAPFGESLRVGILGGCVKHPSVGTS